ncbi:MAG: hypothetical protein K0U78_18395 [Actinomycetia bacterium]|nr:hypothetical protein [Actinomycetes bacterium]
MEEELLLLPLLLLPLLLLVSRGVVDDLPLGLSAKYSSHVCPFIVQLPPADICADAESTPNVKATIM